MQEPLLALAPSDLRALACALRTGRLCPPYLPASVQRTLNGAVAGEISAGLQELGSSGMPAAAVARTLELLAMACESRPPIEDVIDLVTTGPEVRGVTNRDTSVVVRELFHKERSPSWSPAMRSTRASGFSMRWPTACWNEATLRFGCSWIFNGNRETLPQLPNSSGALLIVSAQPSGRPIGPCLMRCITIQGLSRPIRKAALRSTPSASWWTGSRFSSPPRISPRLLRKETSKSDCGSTRQLLRSEYAASLNHWPATANFAGFCSQSL